jgi:hypothetical protein
MLAILDCYLMQPEINTTQSFFFVINTKKNELNRCKLMKNIYV